MHLTAGSSMQPCSKCRIFNWRLCNNSTNEGAASNMGDHKNAHWGWEVPCLVSIPLDDFLKRRNSSTSRWRLWFSLLCPRKKESEGVSHSDGTGLATLPPLWSTKSWRLGCQLDSVPNREITSTRKVSCTVRAVGSICPSVINLYQDWASARSNFSNLFSLCSVCIR